MQKSRPIFYSVPSMEVFKTLKLAVDANNTECKTYESTSAEFGMPDVLWDTVICIEDPGVLYIHGKIYYES